MILIVGKGGQLGTAFKRLYREDAENLGQDRLDLVYRGDIRPALDRLAPARLVNAAAHTQVDRAEEEEGYAYAVNAAAVEEMAAWAADHDVPFVTFSTDYVFDGRSDRPYLESDPPAPRSAYGRTKLAGERMALAVNPATLVVRTSWLVSGTHPNFLASILRQARRGPLRVVDDQRGRPTVVDDLAAMTDRAWRSGASGVLHVANTGEATWYEFARAAVAEAGLDPDLVSPCASAEFPTAAERPRYSVLGSERLPTLGIEPPHWQESLPAVVKELLEWI